MFFGAFLNSFVETFAASTTLFHLFCLLFPQSWDYWHVFFTSPDVLVFFRNCWFVCWCEETWFNVIWYRFVVAVVPYGFPQFFRMLWIFLRLFKCSWIILWKSSLFKGVPSVVSRWNLVKLLTHLPTPTTSWFMISHSFT